MKKRRILLTGAAGYLAGRMLSQLGERYDLVLLDRKTENREGDEVPGVEVVDLIDRNRDNYRPGFSAARTRWFTAGSPASPIRMPIGARRTTSTWLTTSTTPALKRR